MIESNTEKYKTRDVSYINVSDLVPKEWEEWFWNLVSDGAPFSWGDNSHSLIMASVFLAHVEICLTEAEEEVAQEDIDKFLDLLRGLEEFYIDLEN